MTNAIQNLGALLVGFTFSLMPALAKVDHGTTPLLQTLPQYGITVALNSAECTGQFHGAYHSGTKVLTVCYSGTPGANDHDTVRHEAFHALQHCVTEKRGGHGLQSILRGQELDRFVTSSLSEKQIVDIKSAYPKHHWLTELEAFAGARVYTADQISGLLRQWC